jgi:hypothetical protein
MYRGCGAVRTSIIQVLELIGFTSQAIRARIELFDSQLTLPHHRLPKFPWLYK